MLQAQRLEMSLVPSENCFQAQHMIHPNIPFLSIRQSKKRGSKYHTDLTSPKAWKVVLIIRNGVVFYQNEATGEEIKVHELKNGNQIIMGRHYMEMTIITPLQSNTKSQGNLKYNQNTILHV